jgi:antitoxin (DNA-binding transcriptional repressor) of toxin-antitoxin stability system
MTATVHAEETTLSELLSKLKQGDTILITSGNSKTPVAKIEAVAPPHHDVLKRFGWLAHLNLDIPDSAFFDPLPEEELKMWYEGDPDDPINTGKPR